MRALLVVTVCGLAACAQPSPPPYIAHGVSPADYAQCQYEAYRTGQQRLGFVDGMVVVSIHAPA